MHASVPAEQVRVIDDCQHCRFFVPFSVDGMVVAAPNDPTERTNARDQIRSDGIDARSGHRYSSFFHCGLKLVECLCWLRGSEHLLLVGTVASSASLLSLGGILCVRRFSGVTDASASRRTEPAPSRFKAFWLIRLPASHKYTQGNLKRS
jgi:hypothetical protein